MVRRFLGATIHSRDGWYCGCLHGEDEDAAGGGGVCSILMMFGLFNYSCIVEPKVIPKNSVVLRGWDGFFLLLLVKIDRESQDWGTSMTNDTIWFILFALSTVNVVWLTQSWIVYDIIFISLEWMTPDTRCRTDEVCSTSYVAARVVCRVFAGGGRGSRFRPPSRVWSIESFSKYKNTWCLYGCLKDGVTSWNMILLQTINDRCCSHKFKNDSFQWDKTSKFVIGVCACRYWKKPI